MESAPTSVKALAAFSPITCVTMIRKYNTCEVNDLRQQTDGTITSLFKQVALASFLRARTGGMK